MGDDRRARRRNRRSIEDLDGDSRIRLRRLLDRARLVVLPTSEIIPLVEARTPPGSVSLGVACTDGLGVDQTIAVSEVLAARGYDVTPHLVAPQFRTERHLGEALQRLARRAVTRVLVLPGRAERSGAFDSTGALLEAMKSHPDAPPEIGVVGHPDGVPGTDGAHLADQLLRLSSLASYVSTDLTPSPERLLRWVAEMRVRGLELPVEVGMSCVVENHQLAGAMRSSRRSSSETFDPTRFLAHLAAQPTLDRLDIGGLRIETGNDIEQTAAWRQQTYDHARLVRTV